MNYIKYLVYLLTAHIENYRRHNIELGWRLEMRKKLEYQRQFFRKNNEVLRSRLGIDSAKTLNELKDENYKFEQEHPELFPGLNNTRSRH